MPPTTTPPTDVILAIQDPYMSQIMDGTKTHEFRKYRLQPSTKRIWFYRTAPHSALTHIGSILPAQTRNVGDPPLPETGLGNKEFNTRHKDWEGYDYAYEIVSVWELNKPIGLAEMKGTYGMKAAPRGLVYLPEKMAGRVEWWSQRLVRGEGMDGGGDEAKEGMEEGPENGGQEGEGEGEAKEGGGEAPVRV
ncbi:PUA-like domain-containing protein [Staphylotrichum tortipilum]|uniref:PUA-like domain-containing protein n=1 Tax=Staphylotrichum tortipilum TaxID=2831512 RepID=A0AAN6MPB8_9PEZI|nr:PUA-like domain-containing protein [Staphylotrichum longicolle]